MEKLGFLSGFAVMMLFFVIMLWGIPMIYMSLTGHYLDFGG